jgi:hypothetical protein
LANGGLVGITADQTKAGRFAMLKYENTQFMVAVSDDYGSNWSDFVSAGSSPDPAFLAKPAFEFSRDGVIGLLWRAYYADDSYDVWSAISRDGGKAFSKSLRISHARSPGFDVFRNAGLFGDDIQDLSMDTDSIHLVWGDSRAGFQGVWYGHVPFAAYTF